MRSAGVEIDQAGWGETYYLDRDEGREEQFDFVRQRIARTLTGGRLLSGEELAVISKSVAALRRGEPDLTQPNTELLTELDLSDEYVREMYRGRAFEATLTYSTQPLSESRYKNADIWVRYSLCS